MPDMNDESLDGTCVSHWFMFLEELWGGVSP